MNKEKIDTLTLQLTSIREELSKLQEEKDNIEVQLNDASRRLERGDEIDLEWMKRAEYAFRLKGRNIWTKQAELGDINRLLKFELSNVIIPVGAVANTA